MTIAHAAGHAIDPAPAVTEQPAPETQPLSEVAQQLAPAEQPAPAQTPQPEPVSEAEPILLPVATREVCTISEWGYDEVRTDCRMETLPPRNGNPALRGICTVRYGRRTCY